MFYLPNLLLLLSLISSSCNAASHFIRPRQTLSRSISYPSFTSTSNTSATYDSSHVTSSTSMFSLYNYNLNDSITSLPAPFYSIDPFGANMKNYQDIKSGFCALDDNFCSFKDNNGTIIKANPTNLDDQCVLWDASCSGNKTLAIEKFFNTSVFLSEDSSIVTNNCVPGGGGALGAEGAHQPDCETYNPPGRVSELQKIMSWMRTPQCASALRESLELSPNPYLWPAGPINTSSPGESNCCGGGCLFVAQNVDLYYWPEPDADTSCHSIIRQSCRPLDYGATKLTIVDTFTNSVDIQTYWGCTAKELSTDILSTQGLTTDVYRFTTTTAQIVTIGSLLVKVSSFSPWSSAPCAQDDAASRVSNITETPNNGPDVTIHARAHSLIFSSSITQNNDLPVSTVSEGFTFISPSVYARFHSIQGMDNCGGITISPMMLSFSVGELSTVQGALGDVDNKHLTTNSFNFRDLPCPPQSVMEANWYKPEPCEPYRPLIAMPNQLRQKLMQMNPWFSTCETAYFQAFDPPHTLKPESALLPSITAGDPKAAPVPSPTHDPGARETVAGEGPTLVPPSIPKVDQPKATMNSAPILNHGRPNPKPQPNDPAAHENVPSQPRPDPGDPNTDPKQGSDPEQGSDFSENSGQKADPNPVAQNDPKQSDNVNPIGEESGQGAPPFNALTEGQITTINNQVVRQLSHGISIAGTTLTPGAPPITVSGTPIAYGPSVLAVGTSTVPLALNDPTSITTTVAGHAITAAPNAIEVAGTTLHPGVPGVTLDGTVVSLDTDGHLILGSKTISLTSESAGPGGLIMGGFGGETPSDVSDPIITTIADQAVTAAPTAVAFAGTTLTPGALGKTINGTLVSLNTAGQLVVGSKTIALESNSAGLPGLIMGAFGAGGPFGSVSPSSVQGSISNGTSNLTNSVFQGKAEDLKSCLSWEKTVVLMIAIVVWIQM